MSTQVQKSQVYKSSLILTCEDAMGQKFVIIMGVPRLFASVADAKRYINGMPTTYEVEYAEWAKEIYYEIEAMHYANRRYGKE